MLHHDLRLCHHHLRLLCIDHRLRHATLHVHGRRCLDELRPRGHCREPDLVVRPIGPLLVHGLLLHGPPGTVGSGPNWDVANGRRTTTSTECRADSSLLCDEV